MSYPHYIARVYGTKADPFYRMEIRVVVIICYRPEGITMWTGRSGPGKAYMWLVFWGYLTKLSGL